MLKQRKQKLQEATERFQRSHVPKSVHRKIGHWKKIPNLNKGLEQIHILSPVPSFHGLGVLRNLSGSSRVRDSSLYLPASNNGTLYQKHPSTTVIAYTKLMQEKSGYDLKQNKLLFQKDLEETQTNLKKQHLSSLKNFCQEIGQITFSDSLTSLDSLDAAQQTSNCLEQDATSPLSAQDTVSSALQKLELMMPCRCTPDTSSFCEAQNANASFSDTESQNTSISDVSQDILEACDNVTSTIGKNMSNTLEKMITSDKRGLSLNSETSENAACSFINQSNSVESDNLKYHDTSCNDAFSMNKQCSSAEGKTEKKITSLCTEQNTQTASYNGSERNVVLSPGNFVLIPCKAWGTADVTPRTATESSVSEETSKMVQKSQIKSLSFSNQPMATSVVTCPSETQSRIYSSSFPAIGKALSGNISFTYSSGSTNKVEDILSVIDNNVYVLQKQKKEETHEGMIVAFKEKEIHKMTLSSNTDQNNIKKDHVNLTSFCDSTLKVGSVHCEQHNSYSCQKRNVKLIKSILKKDSKYDPTYFRPLVNGGGLNFEKQTQVCVRDSVELTRMKENRLNIQKPEKKLRWLDETDAGTENEDDDTDICNQNQVKLSNLSPSVSENKTKACSTNSSSAEKTEDPLYDIGVSCSGITAVSAKTLSTSSMSSTGYHFTKHDWASAKRDEKPAGKLATSKAEHVISIKRKSKLIKRPRSDKKIQLSTTGNSRKCTVVQTQSSDNCNKLVKAHGKIIVPCPPHKTVTNSKQDLSIIHPVQPQVYPLPFRSGSHKVSQINSLEEMPVNCISSCDTLDENILLSGNVVNTNSFIMTSFPPSHTLLALEDTCKTNNLSKTINSPIQQDFSNSLSKQNTVCAADGLHLDHMPADKEGDKVWYGLQQPLTQNEFASSKNQHFFNTSVNYIKDY
ncbi:centrosomal protein of 126 kDa isoform X2 [Protopterus annectens]|nr:centrosomal protein of 126 kDa isoform X2 [Protopterus annectens]